MRHKEATKMETKYSETEYAEIRAAFLEDDSID